MNKESKHLLVLTTCPGNITAKQIANEVVMARLAACVQIIPGVQSFFRWVGRVDNSEELLLLIKTSTECYPALERRILSLHPYELPELITVPITGGLQGYLEWIDANTALDE